MKSKFGREIALLTLPIAIIGGVAWWNPKLKSWSGHGAPRGLYEGKPRLEITDWKRETPSALDFAVGISSRWTVTTWVGGVCLVDGKPPRQGGMEFPENLYFAWKRGSKWNRTPFVYGPSELDVMNLGGWDKPPSNKVHLGLPMDLVPHDAEEVRLRGRFNGWTVCHSGLIKSPSTPIDQLIKTSSEAWPEFFGSRAPVLKVKAVRQKRISLTVAKRRNSHDLEVRAFFTYSGAAIDYTRFYARYWVTDAHNNHVWPVTTEDSDGISRGGARALWSFKTRDWNPKNGPFTLRSWMFVDENEWPLQISIPLNLGKTSK